MNFAKHININNSKIVPCIDDRLEKHISSIAHVPVRIDWFRPLMELHHKYDIWTLSTDRSWLTLPFYQQLPNFPFNFSYLLRNFRNKLVNFKTNLNFTIFGKLTIWHTLTRETFLFQCVSKTGRTQLTFFLAVVTKVFLHRYIHANLMTWCLCICAPTEFDLLSPHISPNSISYWINIAY